ncbi:MAG: T9SS type A sorting domain-containing protein [Bacteroidia bacterium]|nr:T9SS type A sorting domain-containing protein [Bacteroidia bacterium]
MIRRFRFVQRRRLLPRLRQRSGMRLSTAIIAGNLLVFFCLSYSYLNLGLPKKALASTMSAVSSGDWTSASTWSAGRVPQDYDTLTIPVGITVNVNVVTQEYLNMKIIVNGTLHFDGGKKIRMCDGMVDIKTGGALIADNNGSKVDICSIAVWTGTVIGTGPLILSGGALPVELVYFRAAEEKNIVSLQWETASQTNCDYFSVERSADGKNFASIINIKAKGNSNDRDTYNYKDAVTASGISYYRLKEVDFDGTSITFNTVTVNVKGTADIVIYPNPVSAGSTATVEIPFGSNDTQLEISAINIEGKKIFSQTINKNESRNNIASFKTEAFPSTGTYMLIVSGNDYKSLKKIIVQ